MIQEFKIVPLFKNSFEQLQRDEEEIIADYNAEVEQGRHDALMKCVQRIFGFDALSRRSARRNAALGQPQVKAYR